MQRHLTDEQLDTLLRTIVADAGADDATVEKAALTPGVWWNIQGQIKQGRGAALSPWPPVLKIWRWFIVGAPITAAAVLLIALYVLPVSIDRTIENAAMEAVPVLVQPNRDQSIDMVPVAEPKAKQPSVKAEVSKFGTRKPKVQKVARLSKMSPADSLVAGDEIKSDFISLSYAREADSGQIVRVKVPSSMMVTVGLVASVEKPSALIDAEVIVGDDGLTRAIRFIQQ